MILSSAPKKDLIGVSFVFMAVLHLTSTLPAVRLNKKKASQDSEGETFDHDPIKCDLCKVSS